MEKYGKSGEIGKKWVLGGKWGYFGE